MSAHAWFSPAWGASEGQSKCHLSEDGEEELLNWSWKTIRASPAPFQPKLTSETDTSHFIAPSDDDDLDSAEEEKESCDCKFEEKVNGSKAAKQQSDVEKEGNQLNFAGRSNFH